MRIKTLHWRRGGDILIETMTTLGSLTEFRPEAECFSAYLERARIFFAANDIAEEKQVLVFLNAIGASMYSLARSLLAPTDPMTKLLKEITDMLSAHFEPKPQIVVERYHFHKREQASGESVADYVAELRRLASKCKFENFLDDALRDRFIVGLRNNNILKRLLTEPDLTLARAVAFTQNMEAAHANAQVMKMPTASLTVGQVEQAVKERVPCYHCANVGHSGASCRFCETVCHKCKKRGHLARVCRSVTKGHSRQWKETHKIDSGPTDVHSDNEEVILHSCVNSVGVKANTAPYKVELEVDGEIMTMEIDTGAAVSLISQKTYSTLFPNVPLMKPSLKLTTYTAETIRVPPSFCPFRH